MGSKSKTPFLLPLIGVLGLMLVGRMTAQTFTNLYSFTALSGALATNNDGASPSTRLILSGNTFYGTTLFGGSSSNGTVFALNADGTGFRTLHSFTATSGAHNTNNDGAGPYGGLILLGNTLYGTAQNGGTSGNGLVFSVNTDGAGFTNLHDFPVTFSFFSSTNSAFTNIDGANPSGGLTLSGNILYGTARNGGTSGNGTVFALNTNGTGFAHLHTFTPTSRAYGYLNTDGANPSAGLILSGNTLYGTAELGGRSANGTVFAVNTDGSGFTNLHNFAQAPSQLSANSDGTGPYGDLIVSSNTLYGTASNGGASSEGTVFKVNTDGARFTNLHSFSGTILYSFFPVPGIDGGIPVGGLVLSSNTLYGTASEGGTTNADVFGYGTVFAINTDGSGFATLYRFSATSTNLPYGARPSAGLVLSSNTLYGTAENGGSWGSGTIFSLPVTSRPLPPQFPPIFADFTAATILTANMTITPGAYFTYNTNFPGSWDIAADSFGFVGTFDVPATGTYKLTVNHQTSAAASCPGGGYSPVNIYVNGTQIASNFDPAQQSDGSLGEVTNSWLITATAGVDNTLKWAAGPLCSRYWIEGIQITPVPSPVLSVSVASNNAVLSWSTNLVGYVLESSATLEGVWSPVSPTPTVVGAMNFATNAINASLQFYRLRDAAGQ